MYKISEKIGRLKKLFEPYPRINGTELFMFIKFLFYGFIFVECAFFLKAFINHANNSQADWVVLILLNLFPSAYLLFLTWGKLWRIIDSKRLDILLWFLIGPVIICIKGSGFFSDTIAEIIKYIGPVQSQIIFLSPSIVYILILVNGLVKFHLTKKTSPGLFLSEKKLSSSSNDELEYNSKACNFAKNVFNNGSDESIVFGLNGPWGVGKSSFLELSKGWWKENCGSKTIIYEFNPLQHNIKGDFLPSFVEELINHIQKCTFSPELRPLISRYSRLIRELKPFEPFGFKIPTRENNYLLDDAFDDLSFALEKLDKKIIIIIDDLDRLGIEEIKNILYIIRKCFSLPNITYILCYDLENIASLESKGKNTEKLSEFLEKFINIRISIYPDKTKLSSYITHKILADSTTGHKLKQVLSSVASIYDSGAYHDYVPFLGDIRKLKTLVNTIIFLDLQKQDYGIIDINSEDLIHLLLIYIYCPKVFRDVYNSETQGASGKFALKSIHENSLLNFGDRSGNQKPFKNSEDFNEYLKKCEDESAKFLLRKIFDESRLPKSITEEDLTSLACFNGSYSSGKNLTAYLDLIVNQEVGGPLTQHKTYENAKKAIFSKDKTIEEVTSDPIYSFDESGFHAYESFWSNIMRDTSELTPNLAISLIYYIVNTLKDRAYLSINQKGYGYREVLLRHMVKLLDRHAWRNNLKDSDNTSAKKVLPIARIVFGDSEYSGKGILEDLTKPDKGVLGFLDVIHFRQNCVYPITRLYNLSRSMGEHGKDGNGEQAGESLYILIPQLREISQKIFGIFKTRYIDTHKNIFSDFHTLGVAELAGKYSQIFESYNPDQLKVILNNAKGRHGLVYVVSELSGKLDGNKGHPLCGGYDPSGDFDKGGIFDLMNNYLFDLCFNPDCGALNLHYFVNYIFLSSIQISTSLSDEDSEPQVNFMPGPINQNISEIDSKKLAYYWDAHKAEILSLNLDSRDIWDIPVDFGNVAQYYKELLVDMYKFLDDNLSQILENEIKQLAEKIMKVIQ